MTAVVVTRRTQVSAPPQDTVSARATGGHPKMTIVGGGRAFTVPYAPVETTTEGFAPTWDTVSRGGRDPLLLRSGNQLRTIQFQLVVAFPNPNTAVTSQLAALAALAESGERLRVNLDSRTARFLWRLTDYSEQVIARQHGTNAPTRAICSMKFAEAADGVKAVGPASGGGGNNGGGKDDDKKRPKVYVWKKGDTMQKVAKRFYGKAELWDELADHNKIKQPKKVKVGTKIRLPRRGVLTGETRDVLSDVSVVRL